MKNKTLKQGLVGLVAGIAITLGTLGLTGCSNPKNDIYSRIDNSNYSYENKQIFKEGYRNLDIKKSLKEMGNNPNYIKKLIKSNKEQRKKIAIDFNKDIDANFIDPNNVSDKDIIFIYELMCAKYEGLNL